MELGAIGLFLIFAGILTPILLPTKKEKPVDIPKGSGRTKIELVNYRAYNSIIANIPSFVDPIISQNVEIRFIGFPKIDPENPSHKLAASFMFRCVSEMIESNTDKLEIGEYLRGNGTGFYLNARLYVDGVDIKYSIRNVPRLETFENQSQNLLPGGQVPREMKNDMIADYHHERSI